MTSILAMEETVFLSYALIGVMCAFYARKSIQQGFKANVSVINKRKFLVLSAISILLPIIEAVIVANFLQHNDGITFVMLLLSGGIYWGWTLWFIPKVHLLGIWESGYVPGSLLLGIIPLVIAFLLDFFLIFMKILPFVGVFQSQLSLLAFIFIYITLLGMTFLIYRTILWWDNRNISQQE